MKQETVTNVGKRLLCEAMRKILKTGGKVPFRVLRQELEAEQGETIPERFRAFYDTNPRDPIWVVAIHSRADRYDKAGFLTRKSGIWGVTPSGEEALSQGDDVINNEANEVAKKIYRDKARQKGKPAAQTESEEQQIKKSAGELFVTRALENEESEARLRIRAYINSKSSDSEYAEHLVAALLRAVGYETSVTQRSRDGGIDVIAAVGELGSSRIWVQVKNQQADVGEKPVRELAGVLTDKSDTDTALFVSFAGFVPGAREFAERSSKQIKLVDCYEFIDLWCKHYNKLSDDDKGRLPLTLKSIYFLDEKRAKQS